MSLYSERPARALVQVLADLLAIGTVYVTVRIAMYVYDLILKLQTPGRGLMSAGTGLKNTFDNAAEKAGKVPLAGGPLADALHTGSDAGRRLTDAGRWQVEAAGNLALWMAILLVAVPVLFLLVTWLPLRLRFARKNRAARQIRAFGPEGLDLLALRALATGPLPRLAAHEELATGWRERNPEVLRKLAGWELGRAGLRHTKV